MNRRVLLGSLLFFLCTTPIFGQSKQGNITAQSTDCSVIGSCVVLNLTTAAGGATITLTGTWSGTLQFEVSGDNGLTWAAASTASSTIVGVTNISVAGYTNLRVRCSAYVSGTVNTTLYSGSGSIRGSGSGGGPGSAVLINQFVDTFNRTGTGLGANYAVWLNGINTTLGPPSSAVGSNTGGSVFNLSAFTAVPSSNGAQRVRMSFSSQSVSATGAALRINGTPTTSVNFYFCTETTTTLSISKVTGSSNGAAGTVVGLASVGITGVAGDYIDFAVVGNDLTCVRNGSTSAGGGYLQVDDSTFTTGVPGIELAGTSTAGYVSFFNATLPASGTENIIFEGDSIIAANGNGSPTTDPATSFLFIPNAHAYAVNLGVGGKGVGVGIAAVSVGTLQTMLATGTSVVDPLFVPGVKNIVVLFGGTNDIAVGGRTPAQVITDMTTYVTARHAAGWKVVVCQSLSRLSVSAPATTDQEEVSLANLVAANPMAADAVVIWPYAITAMGASGNANLFNADQIHPTELTHTEILARVLSSVLSTF